MELPEPHTHAHPDRINASSDGVSVSHHDAGGSQYQALASKKPQKRSTSTRAKKSTKQIRSRRGTVLVVDDVPDVTEMIELLLKSRTQ